MDIGPGRRPPARSSPHRRDMQVVVHLPDGARIVGRFTDDDSTRDLTAHAAALVTEHLRRNDPSAGDDSAGDAPGGDRVEVCVLAVDGVRPDDPAATVFDADGAPVAWFDVATFLPVLAAAIASAITDAVTGDDTRDDTRDDTSDDTSTGTGR